MEEKPKNSLIIKNDKRRGWIILFQKNIFPNSYWMEENPKKSFCNKERCQKKEDIKDISKTTSHWEMLLYYDQAWAFLISRNIEAFLNNIEAFLNEKCFYITTRREKKESYQRIGVRNIERNIIKIQRILKHVKGHLLCTLIDFFSAFLYIIFVLLLLL